MRPTPEIAHQTTVSDSKISTGFYVAPMWLLWLLTQPKRRKIASSPNHICLIMSRSLWQWYTTFPSSCLEFQVCGVDNFQFVRKSFMSFRSFRCTEDLLSLNSAAAIVMDLNVKVSSCRSKFFHYWNIVACQIGVDL